MKQVIVGGYNDALNYATTTPEYNCLMGGYTWDTTENKRYQCIPTGGTLGRLFVELSADPTNANSSYTFTVMVDGVASAIVVVIAAGSTTGSYTGATIDVVAGKTVSLRCVATATDPASATARWTIQFIGTTAGESICLVNIVCNTSADCYSTIQGWDSIATETRVQAPIPTPGTFKKLYVQLSTDPGTSPDAYTIALRVGGASKNNTVTIVADNTSGNITNVTDVVAAGNLVDFIVSPVSTPSATPYCAIGIVFVADTDGESLIIGGPSFVAADKTSTWYANLCGAGEGAWSTTETSVYSLVQVCTIKKLYVSLDAAPGTGNSYTISINKDGGAASGLTVTISGASAVSGNDVTHTYDPADGDTADIKSVPTSSPDSARVHIGLVCYIAVPVIYDETGKLQVILTAQGEADIQAMSEVGKEQTILGVLTAADIQAMVETGKEQVVLVAQGEADGFAFFELGLTQVVLAVVGESENLTLGETGKLQVILGILSSADVQTMQELGVTQVLLATLASADVQTMQEFSKLQEILAVVGETEALALDETAREQIILSVLGESETLALLETARLQVVLAVLDEADVQTMQELGITQIVLVVAGEVEAATYPELGRLQEILAVIDETDIQAIVEAREQIIKVVLTSADNWAVVEALGQIILVVIGKEEGRLLKSKRTTGKARVLDAIREEGVERVLDSDVVPH